jgi:diketogulonate reductase-like aldo/keto reductase
MPTQSWSWPKPSRDGATSALSSPRCCRRTRPAHAPSPACERSLKRLNTDRIDLYLLHWRGRPRLEETLSAFEALVSAGAIRYWGVSNFDVGDMEELFALPGGDACATNQVLYNLRRRGIEAGLLPWCGERGVPIQAYSPIEQGRLLRDRVLTGVAIRHRATTAQIALAWVLRQPDMMVIP